MDICVCINSTSECWASERHLLWGIFEDAVDNGNEREKEKKRKK